MENIKVNSWVIRNSSKKQCWPPILKFSRSTMVRTSINFTSLFFAILIISSGVNALGADVNVNLSILFIRANWWVRL